MSMPLQSNPRPNGQPVHGSRFAALHERDFTLYWSGMLVSNVGTWMQNVALGWWVVHAVQSPLGVGMLGASQAIPMILIPPFGGAIADRVSRLALLKCTQIAMLALAAAMAILIGGGHALLWQVLVLNGLSAIALAFDNPTRQAFIADVVDRPALMSAISLNATAYQGAGAIGPAIAGGLIPFIGITGCLYVNAASYLAVLVALFLVRHHSTPRANIKPIGAEILGGFRYIRQTPLVLSLLLMASSASLFGRSYYVLLPLFAKDVLHTGAQGFGLLQAMPGIGTLAGGIALAAMGDLKNKGRLLLITGLSFSVLVAGFSLSRVFVLCMLLLVGVGAMSTTFGALTQTLLQLEVPADLRGRVFSLNSVTTIGMSSFGGFVLGAAATGIGTPAAIAAGAVIVALTTPAIISTQTSIRHFEAGQPRAALGGG